MRFSLLNRAANDLDARLDRRLLRHRRFTRGFARYGWVTFVALALVITLVASFTKVGRSQQILYVSEGGDVVMLDPDSGASSVIYEAGDGAYATGLTRTGGSRNLAFTVLKESGGTLRGDIYTVDMNREARARITNAAPGEVFASPDFSFGTGGVSATHYSRTAPPNTFTVQSIGYGGIFLEPNLPGRPALLGPVWISENALFSWSAGESGRMVLKAYNFAERRQATVYETRNEVGYPAYHRDSNALVFAERPRGAPLAESRLRLLVGTDFLPISGIEEGTGVYDPSPPTPALDGEMAVIWTDGEEWGIGLLDPETREFRRTDVRVPAGSRNPQISRNGDYVATTGPDGTRLLIQELATGREVARVEGLQRLGTTMNKMKEHGLRVPPEAEWFTQANFGWRALRDGQVEP
ncbi:hypothetical protein E0L93_09810 [Rubrobacter taiwanensis]|jgi:hypothetical protein|uniref:WD40 repeat domain-containing protein n=1 Tax=Rubrobacter taiwanensis TaxID=185139 RepID=A0A4R1BGT6_9ACTN|nr:hypothetical protein [Rubrobacter taiwanensis]TCJ16413.1 hypothetical protein E0L93_09810 [Rubrobacter taiwanensis]